MKTIRKVLAAVICMAMLLGSVSVFAAEADVQKAPEKSANPSMADANEIINYVSDIVDAEDVEYYSSSDSSEDLEYRLKHCPEGTLFVCAEKDDVRCTLAEYFWYYEKDDYDYNAPFGSDDKAKYDEVYDACIEVLRSFKYATGECYSDDLTSALDAVENEITAFRTKNLEIIADDAEAPEGVEWIRESVWHTFCTTVDNIYANDYPAEGEWDDLTRVRCQELIERFTSALNAAKAGSSFAQETPSDTPQTSEGTTQTPTGNSVVTATGTTTVAAAVEAIATTSSVKGVKSTVSGAYFIKKVNGVAVITPMADIVAGYGIGSGERLYAKVWDLDPKKSYMAKQVIDIAATSVGAEVGPGLNIELGKLSGGKYSLLSQDGSAITIKVGIPAGFVQNGKTYAVVRVRPGGAVSILADQDTDIDTVTFTTTGGAGAYAIVRY